MAKNDLAKSIVSAASFSASWWLCILYGNYAVVLVAMLAVYPHLKYISKNPKLDAVFLIILVAFGICVDSLLIRIGLLQTATGSLWPPLWLMTLWAVFAIAIQQNLSWFRTRLILASCVGAVMGATCYSVGARLSDMTLNYSLYTSFIALMFVWAILFPAALQISNIVRKQASYLNPLPQST